MGQAQYYRTLLSERYPYDLNIRFEMANHDKLLEYYLNKKNF